MHLDVDFSALWREVKRISDERVPVRLRSPTHWMPPERNAMRLELKEKGIEVDIREIKNVGGLLSYQGQHVVLYIPDHGERIEAALEHPGAGNKFHVADCSTLKQMRFANRYARYVATTSTGGYFRIIGINRRGDAVEGEAKLHVCKNCMRELNYRNYAYQPANVNVADFSLADFFERYASVFVDPPPVADPKAISALYPRNWAEISRRTREEKHWTCERCGVNLSHDRHLLHVHHMDGVKSNVHPSNLRALCASCHRLMPKHEHLAVRLEDQRRLNELRFRQGILNGMDWRTAMLLADPALHGGLYELRMHDQPVPLIWKRLPSGRILDLAWPEKKLGVALDAEESECADGWRILSFADFNGKFVPAQAAQRDDAENPDEDEEQSSP